MSTSTNTQSQPHYGESRAQQTRINNNPYASRQSTHPEVHSAAASQRQPSPVPNAEKIKIPYKTYQKAGPHNARPTQATASRNVGKNAPSNKTYNTYEQQLNERNRAKAQANAAQPRRRRGSSLSRFMKWIKKTLEDRPSGPPSSYHEPRPSTAPGNPKTQLKQASKPSGPAVSTGLRASFDQDSQPAPLPLQQRAPTPGYVSTSQSQTPNPAGFNYGNQRDTSATTWTSFLERTNQIQSPAPATTPRPAPNQIPRKPIPSHLQPGTAASTKSSKSTNTRHSGSTSTSSHTSKNSASKLIQKLPHAHAPSRRNSTDSDLSFMCSGVDDEALQVTNPKRAAIIARQQHQRSENQRQRQRDSTEHDRANHVFAKAKAEAARRQQALDDAEAEARLEERLQKSMYGEAAQPKLCESCHVKVAHKGQQHCGECAAKRQRPESTGTVYNVDLSSFAGGFARPPSSIYAESNGQGRSTSSYMDPGNPYVGARMSGVPPPVPPVPKGYAHGDGYARDTAFYREIEEVQDCYASTPRSSKQSRR